jgi:hypothetical protein
VQHSGCELASRTKVGLGWPGVVQSVRCFSKRAEVLDTATEETLGDPSRASEHFYRSPRLLNEYFLADPIDLLEVGT